MNLATCGNCDSPLHGPYCAQCGQHAHDSARTLGALLHDGWHTLTHLDGRFWATLRRLLLRPGQLTLEYFAARRARYVPPVRLYLVLSLLLLVVSSLAARVQSPSARHAAPQAPLLANPTPVGASGAAASGTGAETTTADPGADPELDLAGADWNLRYDPKRCDRISSSAGSWLTDTLQDACRRNAGTGSGPFLHAFKTNLPRMMFVFLPLIACVMSLLYWFPRRYYVEHLVFFLHNHAALYLALMLQRLCAVAAHLLPAVRALEDWSYAAAIGYSMWYIYRSTRTFYGQGRGLTLVKLGFVSVAYLCFMAITLLGTLLVTALLS